MLQLWGYSWDRLEIGGALSSSTVHMGLGLLFTEGQPLIGMMISTALGGVDTYIRYDLFPSPKYELSLGMATVATYSLLGASDISVASGASMRASYSTKKGAQIFVESSLPIYGLEYTDSCAQAPEGGVGWKCFFDKDILPVVKAKRKMEAKGMLMASSVVFFSSC